jgi:hypothetical protein
MGRSEVPMRSRLSVVLVLAAVLLPTHALAQAAGVGATLVHSEGEVYLDDRALGSNALPSVLPGEAVVRTNQGRAAIALKRGGFLFLDSGTSVRVLGNAGYNFNRIEILTGSAIVASDTSTPLVDCENEIGLSDAGIFRIDVRRATATGERSCQLRVFAGAAAVPLATLTSALRAGQTMMCNRRCGDMVQTNEFPREQLDVFDRWAQQMRERLRK